MYLDTVTLQATNDQHRDTEGFQDMAGGPGRVMNDFQICERFSDHEEKRNKRKTGRKPCFVLWPRLDRPASEKSRPRTCRRGCRFLFLDTLVEVAHVHPE